MRDHLNDPRIGLQDFLLAFPEGQVKTPSNVFQLNPFCDLLIGELPEGFRLLCLSPGHERGPGSHEIHFIRTSLVTFESVTFLSDPRTILNVEAKNHE